MYPQKLTESVIKTKQSGRSFHAFMALEKKKELLNEIVFSDMHIIPCVLFSWEEILFGWSWKVVWKGGWVGGAMAIKLVEET